VEEPVIIWSDDYEGRQQVSAVADLLKKFIITERDANNSTSEVTSRRNTTVYCNPKHKQTAGRRIVPMLMSRKL